MKNILFVLSFLFLGVVSSFGDASRYRTIDSLSGRSFQIINVAVNEALKTGCELEKFKITLMEANDIYIVSFSSITSSAEGVQVLQKKGSFKIEISKATLAVVRVVHIR